MISEETKIKMSLAKKGKIPKNLKMIAGWNKGKQMSKEWREKLSLAKIGTKGNATGHIFTKEQLEKLSNAHLGQKAWNKGMKFPEKSGEKHFAWKGGITSLKRKLAVSTNWKEWRMAIFKRDGYKCFDCGNGGYLEPHHIIPLKVSLDRIFDINNGITLCRPCHKKTMGKELEFAKTYFSFVQIPVLAYDNR